MLWFRFYTAAHRNPKVARLSDKDYRLWTELLTVAAENDGWIPPVSDLKHLLNKRLDHLLSAVDRLISGGLIDRLTDGYEPHDWSEFQYKSDTSTERVRKHRRSRNVSVTPPETETEAESSVAKATGANAPFDPEKIMFDSGIQLLTAAGKTEAQARALIGKWKKGQGTPEVIAGIGEAVRLGVAEPVAWMEARWKARGLSAFEFEGGPC